MAELAPIASGLWFIGADLTLRFTVYADAEHTACVDVSTYTLQYVLRKHNKDADPALISKTVGSGITVTGAFHPDPATNAQVVLVAIADVDTDDLKEGDYQHALKRQDAGVETVLAYTTLDSTVFLTKAAL